MDCEEGTEQEDTPTQADGSTDSFYSEYAWVDCDGIILPCTGSDKCPPETTLKVLMGLHGTEWRPLRSSCRGSDEPTVTPAQVATAFARIPLPRITSIAQPDTKTLVNFDTIFHASADPLTRRVTLLGQRIELQITPSSFHWVFGDGETSTTTTPGAAYPAKTLTHRYKHATTVQHHVEVTWTARWRLGRGAFQDVPGSVTTTGPSTALRIVEATPNLTGAR